VHNAGIAIGGAFEDLPDADVRRVMETNFFGVLELTRALLPALRAQRGGRILIVSSEAAFMGEPANAVYCASKWAVEGWAEAIAYELSAFGIEIVLVEPGPFPTDIWKAPRACPPASPYRAWVQFVFRAGDAHLANRGGDPIEVARTIADVLEARRPRFRTTVGGLARLSHFLRGKVPNRLFRRAIERYLGLSRLRP
jgi:NAD(P)-dependent dehydrogenase (short-subunit alcohol dehydrogenase family)